MTTAPDPPQLRTVLALRQLGSALAATNRAVGGALGIKDTDLAVLDVLHQEGPLTPTQLARRTRTHPATMTGVLGRLERGGWIERRPDAADRRSVRIRAAGAGRLAEVYARADEELAGLTAGWSDEQVAALIGFLDEASNVANRLVDDLAPSGMSADARRTGRRGRCTYAHAMSETARFQQRTASVGMKVDVTDIADTLELLDSYDTETAR